MPDGPHVHPYLHRRADQSSDMHNQAIGFAHSMLLRCNSSKEILELIDGLQDASRRLLAIAIDQMSDDANHVAARHAAVSLEPEEQPISY